MKGETAERWRQVCEQAAVEQDPQKLMQLISQITKMLEEKEQRLLRQRPETKKQGAS
jgi:hypothetical protein